MKCPFSASNGHCYTWIRFSLCILVLERFTEIEFCFGVLKWITCKVFCVKDSPIQYWIVIKSVSTLEVKLLIIFSLKLFYSVFICICLKKFSVWLKWGNIDTKHAIVYLDTLVYYFEEKKVKWHLKWFSMSFTDWWCTGLVNLLTAFLNIWMFNLYTCAVTIEHFALLWVKKAFSPILFSGIRVECVMKSFIGWYNTIEDLVMTYTWLLHTACTIPRDVLLHWMVFDIMYLVSSSSDVMYFYVDNYFSDVRWLFHF